MNGNGTAPQRLTGFGRAGVVALVFVAVLGRAVFLALPVNSDTAMFVYAGKLVAEGGRPGVDLLDNKLPTVGLLMSVPWRAFGANWSAYAAIGLCLSLLASAFLWRAVRDLWGRPSAVIVAVGSVVWLNFLPAVYGGLQLEIIESFFAAIAAATTLRLLRTSDWRDAVLVGLCGGMAAWAKPTGGAVVFAAAMAIVAAGEFSFRKRVTTAGWIALGAAVPIVVAAWTMVITGMADALPETVKQLRDYAGGSSFDPMDAAKPLLVLGLLGLPCFVFGVICRRDRVAAVGGRPDVLFVGLWLAFELLGVVSQRRMYAYHFLPLGPPAALAAGLIARRVRFRSILMAFGPVVTASLVLTGSAWQSRPAVSREDRLIAYVKSHTSPGDRVWADDYPRLLAETGRRPGSSVPLIFLMANGDAAPAYFGQHLLDDFAERRPACIVFASDPARLARLYNNHMADVVASPTRGSGIAHQFDRIARYLAATYHAEAQIDGMTVWRRNADAAAVSVADTR